MSNIIRITKSLRSKGKLIREDEIRSHVNSDTSFYQSLYYYPEDAMEYFENNRSVKGYKGEVFTPYIIFDIDSKDLEESRESTIKIIDVLTELGLYKELASRISFSGSKGYHLYVKTDYNFDPKELKSLCKAIAKKAGVKIDTSIYNVNRIIRVVNTTHEKSGLHKIDILESDFRSMTSEEIMEYAKTTQEAFTFTDTIPVSAVKTQLVKTSSKKKPKTQPYTNLFVPPTRERKDSLNLDDYPCYKVLQEGDMQDGESNQGMLRLAQFYKNFGFTVDEARVKLIEAIRNRIEKYPHTNHIEDEKIDNEILSPVFSQGYTYTCADEFLLDKCTGGTCKLHKPHIENNRRFGMKDFPTPPKPTKGFSSRLQGKKEVGLSDRGFESFSDTAKGFKTFAENIDKWRIETGIAEIDDYAKVIPNGLTIINARPGVGKTTLVLNMLQNSSKKGVKTIFYCADMEKDEFLQKAKSKALGISPDDVFELYNDPKYSDMIAESDRKIDDALSNVYPCYENRLTVDKIESDLQYFAEKGEKIGGIFIDYVQKLEGCHDYGKGAETMIKLKSIVSRYKVPIICLSQIPRVGGNEETPVETAAAAKGGSIYEETASIVINLWRPLKFCPSQGADKVIAMKIAKNRMGECPPIKNLYFDGRTSIIRSMTPDEYAEFEINFQAYQEAKSEKKKGKFR